MTRGEVGGDCWEGWRGEKGEAQQSHGLDFQTEDTGSVTLDVMAGMTGGTPEAYEMPTALEVESPPLYQRSVLSHLVWE